VRFGAFLVHEELSPLMVGRLDWSAVLLSFAGILKEIKSTEINKCMEIILLCLLRMCR
jgi:hypothetical protein